MHPVRFSRFGIQARRDTPVVDDIDLIADNVPPVVGVRLSKNPVRPGRTVTVTVGDRTLRGCGRDLASEPSR